MIEGGDRSLSLSFILSLTAGLYQLDFSLYTPDLHGGTLGSTGFHILNRTEAATMSLTDLPSASATSTQAVIPYLEAFPDGARSSNGESPTKLPKATLQNLPFVLSSFSLSLSRFIKPTGSLNSRCSCGRCSYALKGLPLPCRDCFFVSIPQL